MWLNPTRSIYKLKQRPPKQNHLNISLKIKLKIVQEIPLHSHHIKISALNKSYDFRYNQNQF